MNLKQIVKVFDQFQKSRLQFVMGIADLSENAENIHIFLKANVISQLYPLLFDVVPVIQQTAVVALANLADHSKEFAAMVLEEHILPQLFESILLKNRYYKKAVAGLVHAMAKHSPQLAQAVVDCGTLDTLVLCLEDHDPWVKEAIVLALAIIAQHGTMLSQAVVNAGAVPILVTCLQEPEVAIKRNAASALCEISKHKPALAQTVMHNGAIAHLAKVIFSPDAKLKRHALSALSQISKHSVDLANMVIAADIFPAAMICFRDLDVHVKKNIITLIMEVVKHNADLSQVIVNCGGLAEVTDYLGKSRGNMRLPGIVTLGCIAAHGELLAMSVILSRGVEQLAICLSEETEDHMKAATVLSIDQIGHHTPEHANAVATAGLLPQLLHLYMNSSSSNDLRLKSEKALENILQRCTHLPSLEPLLHDAPSNILKHVLSQFSKLLAHDRQARQRFVRSGGLRKVQEINAEPGSAMQEQISAINNCFPEEVLQYYTPGYAEKLLELLENDKSSYLHHSTLEMQDQLCWQDQMAVMEARDTPPMFDSPLQTPQRPQAEKPRSRPPYTHPRQLKPPDLPLTKLPRRGPTHAPKPNHAQPTTYASLNLKQVHQRAQTASHNGMRTRAPQNITQVKQPYTAPCNGTARTARLRGPPA